MISHTGLRSIAAGFIIALSALFPDLAIADRVQVQSDIMTAIDMMSSGKFQDAMDILSRYETDGEKLNKNGLNAFDNVTLLAQKGHCSQYLGRYKEAISHYMRADSLIAAEGLFFCNFEIPIYKELSNTYLLMDDSEKALEWCQKALSKEQQAFGLLSPQLDKTYQDLCAIYRKLNNQPAIIDALKRRIEIFASQEDPQMDVYDYFNMVYEYCLISYNLNQIKECLSTARALEQEFSEVDNGGVMHLRALNLLVKYLLETDADEAIECVRKAAEIARNLTGDEAMGPDAIAAMNNAAVYLEDSDPAATLSTLKNAIEKAESEGHTDNGLYASLINNYALALGFSNPESAAIFEKAFKIIYKQKNADVVTGLLTGTNWILSLMVNGNDDSLTSAVKNVQDFIGSQLHSSFAFLSEENRNLYWNQVRVWYQFMLPELAAIIDTPEIWRIYYDGLLQSRGILLSSAVSLKKLVEESSDPELKRLYAQYADLGNLDNASPILNALETRLLKESKRYGNFMDSFAVSSHDVSKALKKGEAAIEFFRYDLQANRIFEDTLIESGLMERDENAALPEAVYFALVLKAGSDTPETVMLCDENILADWSLNSLYASIWENLQPYLTDVNRIYFSPDGELFSLPIECAQDDEGRFLWEKYDCRRLSSTRELVSESNETGKGSAIFGGMKFDMNVDEMVEDAKKYRDIDGAMVKERGNRDMMARIEPLPGTLTEVKAIKQIVDESRNPAYDATLYVGKEATETAFKAISGKKKKIVHIATHGFYDKLEDNLDSDDLQSVKSQKEYLANSGLLFAGVENVRYEEDMPPDIEDGVLYAYEIAALDLHGVDLVVLAACKSALGKISSDGVFGLQRGFKKAGAKSIMMALWKVDDEVTCRFMTEFYDNLINNKECKGDKNKALTLARDAIRRNPQWQDKRYWASFILLDAD